MTFLLLIRKNKITIAEKAFIAHINPNPLNLSEKDSWDLLEYQDF